MTGGKQTLLRTIDAGELEAQRVACSYLVKGCERALFHFGLVGGETANADAARVDMRAVAIMRTVLDSWRDTLSLLPPPPAAEAGKVGQAGWMVMHTPDHQRTAIKRRAE
jgi:hypothetical protein